MCVGLLIVQTEHSEIKFFLNNTLDILFNIKTSGKHSYLIFIYLMFNISYFIFQNLYNLLTYIDSSFGVCIC